MNADFDKYIEATEPEKSEKANIWKTAIGLQDVDNLSVSPYLIQVAEKHIEGEYNIQQVYSALSEYYEEKTTKKDADNVKTREADIVSAHISDILCDNSFSLSPTSFLNIHKRLFRGVFDFAGNIREVNLSKKEWVLNGESIYYEDYSNIWETLCYDFEKEKSAKVVLKEKEKFLEHIAKFISDIWQIHAFREGNTRTTAVFAIKYLRHLGFNEIDNDTFAEHSWYFRNALVRANYINIKKGIENDNSFLIKFFDNLLYGSNNELNNRLLRLGEE